jgi:hypothetical protein
MLDMDTKLEEKGVSCREEANAKRILSDIADDAEDQKFD